MKLKYLTEKFKEIVEFKVTFILRSLHETGTWWRSVLYKGFLVFSLTMFYWIIILYLYNLVVTVN